MRFRMLEEDDFKEIVQLYINYYNEKEGGMWTEETAYKRIHQIFSREDFYGMVMENEKEIIGFIMGNFQQYDDGFTYDLHEIVLSYEFQNQGYGSELMKEIELRVKEKGAILIQLQSVNDQLHHHFYEKLGFHDASNLVLKTKIL